MWFGWAVAIVLAQPPPQELVSKARQAMIAGQMETAEKLLQAAVSADPGSPGPRFLLGFCLYLENDFNRAEAALALADQKDARVNLYRALSEEGLGHVEAATGFYKQALRLAPRDTETHVAYARLLRKLGQREQAETLIDAALKITPGGRDVLYAKGQCLFDRGEYAHAAEFGERALSAQGPAPSDREIHFLLTRAYLKAGKPDLSAKHRAVFESLPMPLVR
ncbi:MAG TPA: tetratricopeptide repeat protein [Bryobacteraceae bacterium]|nr:tetratricopeptide repeat protein [Bryobacteraceae bacterium]